MDGDTGPTWPTSLARATRTTLYCPALPASASTSLASLNLSLVART